MKRAIWVTGHKGGVGKSTFAAGLLDTLRARGIACAALDADGDVGHLRRHYALRDERGRAEPDQDPLIGVRTFRFRDDVGRDELLAVIEEAPDRILVDMPGGSLSEIGSIGHLGSHETVVEEFARYGYRITLALVLSPFLLSTTTVVDAVKAFGSSVDYVVVKNLFWGDPRDFIFYDGDDTKHESSKPARMIHDVNGVTITMPKLYVRTAAIIDKYQLRYHDAAESPYLPLPDRTRIHHWRRDLARQIDAAAGYWGCLPAGTM